MCLAAVSLDSQLRQHVKSVDQSELLSERCKSWEVSSIFGSGLTTHEACTLKERKTRAQTHKVEFR